MIMLKLAIERLGHPHPQSILDAEDGISVVSDLGSLGTSFVMFAPVLGISCVALPCLLALAHLAHT